MRVLLTLVVLAVPFLLGLWVGQSRSRRTDSLARRTVRPVLTASRRMALVDPLASPQEHALCRQELMLALDQYDEQAPLR